MDRLEGLESFAIAVAPISIDVHSFLANGLSTSSTTASMSEIVFAFRVTPVDLAYGLLFAATMGVIGSLLPAFRAAWLPIVSALREA